MIVNASLYDGPAIHLVSGDTSTAKQAPRIQKEVATVYGGLKLLSRHFGEVFCRDQDLNFSVTSLLRN
jgi:hypothetical protein